MGTWLILPVVICLSQRLSHACLSTAFVQRNCEWLIKSVIIYLIVSTTGITVVILELMPALKPDARRAAFIRSQTQYASAVSMIHNNFTNRGNLVVHSNFCPIKFRL
eukprot:Amastigsp_a840993_13855.p3 type:complete len:107 gc:universal Amastigsp_a840993_13855:1-321(+)